MGAGEESERWEEEEGEWGCRVNTTEEEEEGDWGFIGDGESTPSPPLTIVNS